MDAKELRKQNRAELLKLVQELKLKVRDLRFKVTTRQVAKVRELRVAKKNLAEVETVLKEIE